MEEEKVFEQDINIDHIIEVDELSDAITLESDAESTDIKVQDEIIEYIDVEEQESYLIEVDEAFSSIGDGDALNHAHLTNRDLPGQHPIEAIDGLRNVLNEIQSLKSGLYASSGGLAEFRQWEDKNPTWENRTGYFVSVINGDGEIAICNTQAGDVYGVVVSNSALCGYETSISKMGNPFYAIVCLVGEVKVRVHEDSKIKTGDYVVADNYGYAIKSENNVGFRVLSIGTDPILEHYANIALVPQNDNISRIMKELNTTNSELSNVIIQLGKVEDSLIEIEKNSDTAIEVAGDAKDLVDILDEAVGTIGVQLENVTNIANQARDSAERAIVDANAIYTDATATARIAKESADSALGGINTLQDNLKELVKWEGEKGSSVAGFVAQADDDHSELSYLVSRWGENGTDLIAVRQQINKNGAAIEHLVAHADRYSIGPYSLTYSLTYDEAVGIMRDGHIYVATEKHTETLGEDSYEFELGGVYEWYTENDKSMWIDTGKVVAFYTTETAGDNIDDLWYCLGGIKDENDQLIYYPETLYRWDGSQWISVATIDGNLQARTLGLIKQTANELTSTYTNLRGDVSVMKQTVDNISTTVENVEGELSTINQAADSIIAGTYDPEGSSSLSMLLDYSFKAVSEGRYHKRLNSFAGMTEVVGNRYTQPPSWSESDGKFIFDDSYVDLEGKYYFNSDDQTTYCKDVDGGYETYTIGNTAISALDSRVSETESIIGLLTEFKDDTTDNLTILNQKTDANSAAIDSIASMQNVVRTEINTELSDEDKTIIEELVKYTKAPIWNENQFEFIGDDSEDGIYCTDNDSTYYYKVLKDDNGDIFGFEKYELLSSNLATIRQKVDENGSAIDIVVENGRAKGQVLIEAINDESVAIINADKIGINGTAIFKDNLNDGSTTISGSYIRTGVIQSNDYSAPINDGIYSQAGTRFDLTDGSINSENFNIATDGSVTIKGKISALAGGDIGGFTIGNDFLHNRQDSIEGNAKGNSVGVYIGIDGIGLGHGNFSVDNKGCLYAKDATIRGNIIGGSSISIGKETGEEYDYYNFSVDSEGFLSANSGTIGGWTIGTNFISSSGSRGTTELSFGGILTDKVLFKNASDELGAYIPSTLGMFTGSNLEGVTDVFGIKTTSGLPIVLETTTDGEANLSGVVRLTGSIIYLQSRESGDGNTGVMVQTDGSKWKDLSEIIGSGGDNTARFG